MSRLFNLAVALLLLLALPAAAQIEECEPYQGITCDGWVTDAADVLDDSATLEQTAGRFVEATGHQIAVVTVPNASGMDARQFAEELGNTWGVGDPQENDGVVVLVALEERRTEIVTGPGAELPNDRLSSIASLADSFFANGDFGGGLAAIIGSLQGAYTGSGAGGGDTGESAPTGSDGEGSAAVPIFGVVLLAGGAGAAWFFSRRNQREETLTKHRRIVDQELSGLEPAGHEIVVPDELFVERPDPSTAPDPVTSDALAALEDPTGAKEATLTGLWAVGAGAVGDSEQIEQYRQMPLEMRVSGEQQLLEDAVQDAARAAAADHDPDTFEIKRQELARLVASLRPYRVAEATTQLAREVAVRAVETPIGPFTVTDAGERLAQAGPVLDPAQPLSESMQEMATAAHEAADKTHRMEELYAKLPDTPARPAVAAALADLGTEPAEATERYNVVLSTLRTGTNALLDDGVDLPSVAAFLVMNNDEDDIDEFIASYEEARRLRVDPPTAVEMALAGLRGNAEMQEIREEAGRLGIPVSIAAALTAAGDRAMASYLELIEELKDDDLETSDRRTIAAILALSLEPAQAERRWLETREALSSLGLTGSYADVAAAFGASDTRGSRQFALAYAAQRQELARSTIEDADRYAPELAHTGTSGQRDSWSGAPIPGGMRHFDPFFLFYYHWMMTSTMTHGLGWRHMYHDQSWQDGTWFGGYGGGGGFGGPGAGHGGSTWGSSWGGGGASFGGFGGGGFGGGFGGGGFGGGGSGW